MSSSEGSCRRTDQGYEINEIFRTVAELLQEIRRPRCRKAQQGIRCESGTIPVAVCPFKGLCQMPLLDAGRRTGGDESEDLPQPSLHYVLPRDYGIAFLIPCITWCRRYHSVLQNRGVIRLSGKLSIAMTFSSTGPSFRSSALQAVSGLAARLLSTAFMAAAIMAGLSGCMEKPSAGGQTPGIVPGQGHGLFILCEGTFQAGNSSLSFYDTEAGEVYNNIFTSANDGAKLGDTGQSMTLHEGILWVVVNSSHVIFAVDPVTFKEKGRITSSEMTSPRYMHFVSDNKAYVSQLYDNRILVVDPKTYSVTGTIETGMEEGSASVEQMVSCGDYVIANCWSYQKDLIRIDTRTDKVTDVLEVGVQPQSICLDSDGKLWVLTDGGGWAENPAGYEAPRLVKVDPDKFVIEKTFSFTLGDYPSELQTDVSGENLYFLSGGKVWKMSKDASSLPSEPYIDFAGSAPYALTVCPWNSDIYVADAVDYSQNGAVVRYSSEGTVLDEFRTGICPGSFCWY